MIKRNLFNSKMALFNDNLTTLADHLGISRQTLTLKLDNKSDFTQSEIKKIVIRYNLTPEETEQIFFGDENES